MYQRRKPIKVKPQRTTVGSKFQSAPGFQGKELGGRNALCPVEARKGKGRPCLVAHIRRRKWTSSEPQKPTPNPITPPQSVTPRSSRFATLRVTSSIFFSS